MAIVSIKDFVTILEDTVVLPGFKLKAEYCSDYDKWGISREQVVMVASPCDQSSIEFGTSQGLDGPITFDEFELNFH